MEGALRQLVEGGLEAPLSCYLSMVLEPARQLFASPGVSHNKDALKWRFRPPFPPQQKSTQQNARKVGIMRIARLISSLFLSFAVASLAIPVPSRAQVAVGISVRIGPPVSPVYVQPTCPGHGYIRVPGYWAYGPDG